MNELTKVFDFKNFKIRTVIIDNEVWFVGNDVANVLGYARAKKAIQDHVDKEDKHGVPFRDPIGRVQNTTVINESGVYALIFNSKLPTAKEFKRWVTKEVLPQIRETGGYNQQAPFEITEERFGKWAPMIPRDYSSALRLSGNLAKEVEYYKPRAQRYDLYMASRFYWTITQIAENYGLTAWQMNDLLRRLHVQYKRGDRWYLYAPYKNQGYKVQRPGVSAKGNRYTSTFWTEKGRMFINDQMESIGKRDVNVKNYLGDRKVIPLNEQNELF